MPISGVALRVMKDNFYKENIEKYDTTKEEIVRILLNGGYEAFKAEEMPSYNALVEATFRERGKKAQKIVEAAEKAGDWKKKIFPKAEPAPCPIPECDGVKLFPYPGTEDWKCSKGGSSHCTALKVAKLWASVKGIEEDTQMLNKAKSLLDNMEEQRDKEAKEVEGQTAN